MFSPISRAAAFPIASSYTPDLTATLPGTAGGGAVTPNHMDGTRRDAARRKQTLLTLLDALNELNRDDDLGGFGPQQQVNHEFDKDAPATDEHVQIVGAETFNRFQRKIENLDKELRNFANASRQLGSSVRLLSSAYHLRERLAQILFLFRENAADLFPRKIMREAKESLVHHPSLPSRKRKRGPQQPKAPSHVARPNVLESLDAEDFPFQLQMLAKDVTIFLDCLNEFPEFTDEAVNACIVSLEGDLKYWASCLKTYEGQFKYPAVQRYMHDLMSEMGEHVDSITSTLSMFIEIGVPTIRFAQKHGATHLLNLSTVATFFSAVTATTLQFSYQANERHLQSAVNAFWFSSLVFSVAAAVNSLLGLTWKQAMYRSPGHRVPWWVLIWMKRSPLVFLCISVASFSIGLVLFAYSSGQSPATQFITSVFTAFSSFGLIAVSLWFGFERWTFSRHRGKKWLADVLTDATAELGRLPGIAWITRVPKAQVRKVRSWAGGRLRAASTSMTRVTSEAVSTVGINSEKPEQELLERIPTLGNRSEPISPLSSPGMSEGMHLPFNDANNARSLEGVSESAGDVNTDSSVPLVATAAKSRWTTAVRSVMMMRTASSAASAFNSPLTPRRQRTLSTPGAAGDMFRGRESGELVAGWRSPRLATLVPQLRSLETTQEVPAHVALVKHLQFSPNGKFLATSSWDKTSVIFKVGEWSQPHRILAHPAGFVGQVAWSPSGNLLLTKIGRGVSVWTEDGVCRNRINRHQSIQSIAWCPGGEAFMSVEGSDVMKLDLAGKILDRYRFDRMMLHDVAVTPDCQRLLGVATLLASGDGLQPSKSRAEKQIIVYNLDRAELENQVPVLQDVRDITLARNGLDALVSYENKAPPQLWRVEMVRDHLHNDPNALTPRLVLRHTYMPKALVDFAGPSYFGGKDDQLVLCAGKAGDIHVWDRESGALLHQFRAQVLGGDLTCIAWNHAADAFMFATGSHDGVVRIWTTPEKREVDLRDPIQRTETPTVIPYSNDGYSSFRTDSPVNDSEFMDDGTAGGEDYMPSTSDRRAVVFTEPDAIPR